MTITTPVFPYKNNIRAVLDDETSINLGAVGITHMPFYYIMFAGT